MGRKHTPDVERLPHADVSAMAQAGRPITVGYEVQPYDNTCRPDSPQCGGCALRTTARLDASMVVARARGSEVLVTDSVVEAVRESDHLAFEGIGTVKLKGFDEPRTLYRAYPRE